MTKAITFLQTLFILFLTCIPNGFNLLLAFEDTIVVEKDRACQSSCSSHHHAAATLAIPFGEKLGKVIKQQLNEEAYEIKTVVIDPGHGGHDPGCLGSSTKEKDIALAIGLALSAEMGRYFPNIKVIMTRDEDVFIPLHKRAAIANRNNADLFISIHCNYMPGSAATTGSETYVMGLHTANHNLNVAKRENAAILLEDDYEKNYDYDPNSPEGHIMLSMFQNAFLEQSILFAQRVEDKFAQHAQRKSRGVKQAGFVVLKETTMPSVLVEAGFLSNKDEEATLNTENGQLIVAQSILSAFVEYKSAVEGKDAGVKVKIATPEAPLAASTVEKHKAEAVYTTVKSPTTPITTSNTPKEEKNQSYKDPNTPIYYPPSNASTPNSTTSKSVYTTPSAAELNIIFHVQLAASSRPVDTSQDKWRNTGYMIEVVQEDNLYKYQARNFSNIQQAFEARLLLQARGFNDAFIVVYKNGQRISMEQAKKELGIP
ncbi:MAG TPA: N-acetylmuramoyl-L-alanine amidase [Saprospiraceae bacterium]|nr:N-acetylmuramoyl-L-alanine amidase [Saprospiraceae bacterium]HMQ82087.1 N-acetylmuramoyl-L-alanine amidase [Saprospiraceae bacterium]